MLTIEFKMDPDILWTRSRIKKPLAGTTEKEIKCYRKKLRAGLPSLTPKEIRRYRLKYHEALLEEMREDGYVDSAEYINKLLVLDDRLRAAVGDESLLKGQPRLRDQYLYLDKLKSDLTEAEVARTFGELSDECWTLLNLAMFFMNRAEHLRWIAEQLFLLCLQTGRSFHSDGGLYLATLKYIYGRFLLTQLNRPADACAQLQQARTASVGKVWTAEKELGCPQETIFVECCCLLVKALLLIAEEIREDDPKRSIRFCNQAIRRAIEAGHLQLKTEAFLQLGKSQMAFGEYAAAIQSFLLFLQDEQEVKDVVQICNAHLNLATCYKMNGDPDATLCNLMSLRDVAEAEHLVLQIAAADRFLGEFYITMGFNERALSHLLSSFSMYHRNGLTQEMEEVRALAAVATAQGILPVMADTILANNSRSLNALYRWKNEHVPLSQTENLSRESIMYLFMRARSTSEVKLAKQTLSRDEAIFK